MYTVSLTAEQIERLIDLLPIGSNADILIALIKAKQRPADPSPTGRYCSLLARQAE